MPQRNKRNVEELVKVRTVTAVPRPFRNKTIESWSEMARNRGHGGLRRAVVAREARGTVSVALRHAARKAAPACSSAFAVCAVRHPQPSSSSMVRKVVQCRKFRGNCVVAFANWWQQCRRPPSLRHPRHMPVVVATAGTRQGSGRCVREARLVVECCSRCARER